MNKICLLQQECGIGDVFFSQNIAKKYVQDGYKVIWPLSSYVYNTIPKYLCINGVEYFDRTGDFPLKNKFEELYYSKKITNDENFIFIPIGWSQHVSEVSHERTMTSKYAMCGLNYKQWKDNITINRNREKEEKLKSLLNIKDGERYCLVNNNFATPPDIQIRDVSSAFNDLDKTNCRFIKMNVIPEYSVFDWCGVIENATYIVTVDTCIMYFMEFLQLKSIKNCCFPRNGKYTVHEIHDLFDTSWTYYL